MIQEIEVTSAGNNFFLPAINKGVISNKPETFVHQLMVQSDVFDKYETESE